MKVAVVKETFPGGRRVALVPADAAKLIKSGLSVVLEPGVSVAQVQFVYRGASSQLYLTRPRRIQRRPFPGLPRRHRRMCCALPL